MCSPNACKPVAILYWDFVWFGTLCVTVWVFVLNTGMVSKSESQVAKKRVYP